MEIISKYFAQIRAHLGGLTASQKIAIGLCAVLIVVSGAWLIDWSGRPQRVPLLAQALSADEQAQIVSQLRGGGAEFELVNGQILVAETDRPRLLAQLQQTQALPANTSMSFARLMEENNPFLAREDARWRKARALEAELSGVLRHFDGLSDARVFIQTPERRRIGESSNDASASVNVTPKPGAALDKALAASIATFVSGAVEGLRPQNVRIVDSSTGKSFQTPSPDDALPFDVLALRRQQEEHYTRKIADHLAYIPGVLVGVHAELNLERKSVQAIKLGNPVVSEEESRTSNSSRGGGPAGPGVKPNVGRAVTAGGGEDSTSTEESISKLSGRRDETVTSTVVIPGDMRRLAASINVPRSYYAGIFKQINPKAAEPGDAELKPLIDAENRKIRAQVSPLIAAADETQVDVAWFYDAAMARAAGESGPGGVAMAGLSPGSSAGGPFGDGLTTMGAVREYGPAAGLGLLALIALYTVTRIAGKANAAIVEAGQAIERAARAGKEAEEPQIEKLPTDVELAGEALSTETVLEGHEVGGDEIRIRHIIEQIGQMVNDEPSTAANLLESWVNAAD